MIEIKSQKDDSGSVFSVAVHKELLCLCSPYYTAAIKGGFSESRQESFTVELDHRQTQMFVEWLYTGRCDSDPWQQINNHEVHALYVFADQTDIIAFRRSIMTCLVRGGRAPPTPSDMAKLVSQLPNDSGLRLSRGYVRKDFPEEFWDVLVYGQHGPYLPSCIACDYHEHTDEQEWKMSKKSGQKL